MDVVSVVIVVIVVSVMSMASVVGVCHGSLCGGQKSSRLICRHPVLSVHHENKLHGLFDAAGLTVPHAAVLRHSEAAACGVRVRGGIQAGESHAVHRRRTRRLHVHQSPPALVRGK